MLLYHTSTPKKPQNRKEETNLDETTALKIKVLDEIIKNVSTTEDLKDLFYSYSMPI